ncbi:YeeE/YedE family protein [Marivibrio halodurans]|uniref:YeeE/YedE family protein n=1 Tax=Marivibrio halodurans TaxID=2039722 RepID=A0A8J7S549_9PROT|nr:DUF6691 family protein [Marivibrio halodurans]MBP5858974.1 YeeE/YedE family protein [Marivibrio halodurans]
MRIQRILAGAGAGLLFGLGLALSGMMDPARVIGFLDVGRLVGAGVWDPTLGFVMGGALLVTLPGFALMRRRGAPLLADRFEWPSRRDIDRRLLLGAVLFGAGWGLVGFCPGPALAALSSGLAPVFIFVAAMVAGFLLFRLLAGGK